MDIQPRVTSDIAHHNTDWLGSRFGTEDPQTVTLDMSKFVAATHYPNGFIPDGMPLVKDAVSGLYGPSGAADVDCDGYLYKATNVPNGATKIGAPMLWHGVVILARLPLTTTARNSHFSYL